jgi:putative radical SAM enzyme (TIGR03279 family)
MISIEKPFPPPWDRRYRWQRGDVLVAVDGSPLEDILDLYYYAPSARKASLTIGRAGGERLGLTVPVEAIEAIVSCLAPLAFKNCACCCVFCFIDQNPEGMRPSLYIKDEDYRLSFLYGNYVTLTSLGRRGIDRIIAQNLSPLFVSVHATDPSVRGRMLGRRRPGGILPLLRRLGAAQITIHAQVVLCPGWNDGEVLDRTFADLLDLAPQVASLAVVPVGLTRHRRSLVELAPVTPDLAAAVIGRARVWQREARRRTGASFIHLSDEFYLLADAPLPNARWYDDFPQLDNGIGLTAKLRQSWVRDLRQAKRRGRFPRRPLTILTGVAGARALARDVIPPLIDAGAPGLDVRAVTNDFYGPSVTVSGLLIGADLRRALAGLPRKPRRTVAICDQMFNYEGLTLDGLDLGAIAAGSSHELVVAPRDGFIDFWAGIG